MHVSDFFDVIGSLLMLALVATILTKPNTKSDIQAAGSAFTSSLKQAEAG